MFGLLLVIFCFWYVYFWSENFDSLKMFKLGKLEFLKCFVWVVFLIFVNGFGENSDFKFWWFRFFFRFFNIKFFELIMCERLYSFEM